MSEGTDLEVSTDKSPQLTSPGKTAVDVTVVVVNYNTAFLLDRFFASLEAARADLNVQIVFVDNASRDESVSLVRERYPDVEVIENQVNVGFGRANNQALPFVKGRYVLLLNTDAFVAPETLSATVSFMEFSPSYGILGVKLVGEDGQLQPSCRYFPTPWNVFLASTGLSKRFPSVQLVDDLSWDHASVRECDWVPGCYYLIRRKVIEDIGLFDDRYFLYCEEVDHCRSAIGAGWRVVYYPFTKVVHIGGESAASVASLETDSRQIMPLHIESELLYFRKHFGRRGLLIAVTLAGLADLRAALAALLRRGDRKRAAGAIAHFTETVRGLANTGMATRATR